MDSTIEQGGSKGGRERERGIGREGQQNNKSNWESVNDNEREGRTINDSEKEDSEWRMRDV